MRLQTRSGIESRIERGEDAIQGAPVANAIRDRGFTRDGERDRAFGSTDEDQGRLRLHARREELSIGPATHHGKRLARDHSRARDRDVVPKTAIRSLLRARRYTRADSMFSKLGNIPSEFKELLERCFCVFVKIIRIPSGFEELLDIITPKNKRRGANGFKRDNSVWWSWTEKA